MRLPYLQQFLGNKKIFNARTWFLLSFYGMLLLISSCTSLPTSTQKTLEVSPKPSQSLEKEGAQSQLKTPITANSCGTVVSD
jgi:starvation-inducible outer membrane lipoprotein